MLEIKGEAFDAVISILTFSVSIGSNLRILLYPMVEPFNTSNQLLFFHA